MPSRAVVAEHRAVPTSMSRSDTFAELGAHVAAVLHRASDEAGALRDEEI